MCDSSILFRREAEEAAKKRRDRRKEGLEDSAWEIGGTLEEVEQKMDTKKDGFTTRIWGTEYDLIGLRISWLIFIHL